MRKHVTSVKHLSWLLQEVQAAAHAAETGGQGALASKEETSLPGQL